MLRHIVFLLVLLTACTVSRSITHGIAGKITWYEGDRMPGIDRQVSPGKPIRRTLYIYKLTNLHDAVQRDGVFYDSIKSRLVKKVKTNETGKFSASLHPGKYSVFVKEEKGLYGNKLDGSGNINPVVVREDSVSEMDIRIDYNAYY